MVSDGLTPEQRSARADAVGRLRVARAEVLERAEELDAKVDALVAHLEAVPDDGARERLIDLVMGVCRAADAARAFVRDDLDAARECTQSMSYYARRSLGEAA
jgi:hypothetical protein